MNYYLILPFILLIISIIYFNHYTKSKESFEPWMNFNQPDYKDVNYQSRYNDCMQQGYGDDFCTQSSVPNYKDTLPPEGRCNCVRMADLEHINIMVNVFVIFMMNQMVNLRKIYLLLTLLKVKSG